MPLLREDEDLATKQCAIHIGGAYQGLGGLSPPPKFLPYTGVRYLQVYFLIYCAQHAVWNDVTFAQFCVESPMTVHQFGQ